MQFTSTITKSANVWCVYLNMEKKQYFLFSMNTRPVQHHIRHKQYPWLRQIETGRPARRPQCVILGLWQDWKAKLGKQDSVAIWSIEMLFVSAYSISACIYVHIESSYLNQQELQNCFICTMNTDCSRLKIKANQHILVYFGFD